MIAEEMAAFGRRLGLPGLAWNEDGRVALKLRDLGELTLEKTDDGVRLVLVNAPSEAEGRVAYERLLKTLDWRRRPAYTAQAAWYRGRLILSVLLENSEVTAAALENVLRFAADEMTRALRGA